MRRSQSAATKRFVGSASILRLLRYNRRRLNSVLTQAQPVTTRSNRRLARTALVATAIGALWFILFWQLSGEWSINEQYSYGWLVPFFALFLFWLRWEDRPMEGRAPSRPNFGTAQRPSLQVLAWIFVGIPALLILLPVRLFEIANPDWRLINWLHAAAVTTLTLLYIWYIGGAPWLRHFAFPILFASIAVPWVTPVEVPIVQGLMRAVAWVASETATSFAIPTQLEGNVIRIPSGVVGINEACSGVRSLQTSLMIALLFGELKRLSILRRVALVAGVIAIAFIANCARALFLVWIAATKNIAAVDSWHDVAGYSIVAAVFAGSLLLAMLLGQGKAEVRSQKSETRGQKSEIGGQAEIRDQRAEISSYFLLPTSYFLLVLCWLAFVEIGCEAWYRAHESNLVATTRWDVQWPETAPNFRELKIDEDVRRMLRFDQGHAAVWTWPGAGSPEASSPANSKKITCLLHLFRWNPGRNSALLASSHRPEVCLPATGWKQVADTGVRTYPTANSFALPFRHFEFRARRPEDSGQRVAHAFYCLSEDRVSSPSAIGSKLAAPHLRLTRNERIRQVLEGRRHLGQQVMEVVFFSSEQIPAADAESLFSELVREVVLAKPGNQ
jgi:exosortase